MSSKQFSRRAFLRSTGVGIASGVLASCSLNASPPASASNRKRRPNVIMINIDNHDKSLLGFAGSGFGESPNIDNLYDKGVYLANYQCASRCGPSRTALMTGRYHIRSGHIQTPDGRSVMGDTSVPTVANLFQDAGYKTAMYGKWHIGKNYPYRPEDRGFDEVVTFFQGRLSKTGRGPHTVRHNGKWEEFEGYRIDLWFNELGKFIKKNRTKPFMAYLATWATHGGNFGPDDLSKKYRRKMDSLGEKTAKLFKDKETKYNYAETAAEIESIDRNIGRLTALLNQLGLREDTIIVYTSDGAGFRTPAGLMRKDAKEFPSKVPAIIYWPGGNLNRDTDVTQLVANIDMAPTLLDMCGIDQSEKVKFDGQSAYSLFSPKGAKWKDRIYIADHQSRNGVREGFLKPLDYTNVHFPSGACVSFRKGKAKGASPEMEAAARKHWGAWWKDVTADFKPYHHVIVGTKHENPTIVYQVYTGLNEQKAKVKNYVFAIEFAVAGKYRFGGGRRKSKGYLKIGDKTHTGEFPMTLKLPAGKKMVIVSFDGQKRSGGLTIEWLADEDSQ